MEIYKNLSLENLPNEEWRDVVGYEGLYQVSNMGRVKMLQRNVLANKSQRVIPEHIIKQIETQKGYLSVDLWNINNRKRFMVHRLVLNAFSGENLDKKECNHKNENRKDNNCTNLEWISHKENLNYGSRIEKHKAAMMNHSNMSKPIVQYDLNGNKIREYPSMRQASRELGFYVGNIKECCKERYNSTHGFIFKYK